MNDQLAYNVALCSLSLKLMATIAFCGLALCLCRACLSWLRKEELEAEYWENMPSCVDQHESKSHWRHEEAMLFLRSFAWQVGLTPADVETFGHEDRFAQSGRRAGSPDLVEPEETPALRPVVVPDNVDDEVEVDDFA